MSEFRLISKMVYIYNIYFLNFILFTGTMNPVLLYQKNKAFCSLSSFPKQAGNIFPNSKLQLPSSLQLDPFGSSIPNSLSLICSGKTEGLPPNCGDDSCFPSQLCRHLQKRGINIDTVRAWVQLMYEADGFRGWDVLRFT